MNEQIILLNDSMPAGFFRCCADKDRSLDMVNHELLSLFGCTDTKELEELIHRREVRNAVAGERHFIPISNQNNEGFTAQVICPIISEGDVIGSVIMTSRTENARMGEVEVKLAQAAAGFLGRQLEQ